MYPVGQYQYQSIWEDDPGDPEYDPRFHELGQSFEDEEYGRDYSHDSGRTPMQQIEDPWKTDPNVVVSPDTSIPYSNTRRMVEPDRSTFTYEVGEKNPITGEPLESGKRPQFLLPGSSDNGNPGFGETPKRPRLGIDITGYDAVPAGLVGVADFTSRMGQGQGVGGALVGAGATAAGGLIGDKVGELAVQGAAKMAGRKLAELAAKKVVGAGVGRVLGGALGTLGGPVGTIAGSLVGGMVGEGIGGWIGDRLSGANRQPNPNQLAIGAASRGASRAYQAMPDEMKAQAMSRSQAIMQQAQSMAGQYGGFGLN